MLRFLLVVGILSAAYFCMVGFLRTAEKMGWSESDQISQDSQKPPAQKQIPGKK